MPAPRLEAQVSDEKKAIVLTKAVVSAAERLGLNARTLSGALGVSEPTVSRMKQGSFLLHPKTKPFELGALFVRLFRSLDAIVGGDEATARAWMLGPNLALGGRPVEMMVSVTGLIDVIRYLDARRAPV